MILDLYPKAYGFTNSLNSITAIVIQCTISYEAFRRELLSHGRSLLEILKHRVMRRWRWHLWQSAVQQRNARPPANPCPPLFVHSARPCEVLRDAQMALALVPTAVRQRYQTRGKKFAPVPDRPVTGRTAAPDFVLKEHVTFIDVSDTETQALHL